MKLVVRAIEKLAERDRAFEKMLCIGNVTSRNAIAMSRKRIVTGRNRIARRRDRIVMDCNSIAKGCERIAMDRNAIAEGRNRLGAIRNRSASLEVARSGGDYYDHNEYQGRIIRLIDQEIRHKERVWRESKEQRQG